MASGRSACEGRGAGSGAGDGGRWVAAPLLCALLCPAAARPRRRRGRGRLRAASAGLARGLKGGLGAAPGRGSSSGKRKNGNKTFFHFSVGVGCLAGFMWIWLFIRICGVMQLESKAPLKQEEEKEMASDHVTPGAHSKACTLTEG